MHAVLPATATASEVSEAGSVACSPMPFTPSGQVEIEREKSALCADAAAGAEAKATQRSLETAVLCKYVGSMVEDVEWIFGL